MRKEAAAMKKIIFLILSMSLILCSCARENNSENNTEATGAETFSETAANAEEQAFTGLAEDDIEYGFSPQVNKKDFALQLFCYDDNGNVYFSDPADNYSLYAYDGTESKKLTDQKAVCLNYYDGGIYFLSPQREINIDDMVFPEGYAYVYGLQSGETAQTGDFAISNMTVIDGEIYAVNDDNTCFFYKYDENDPDCRNKKIYNSFVIKKCKNRFLTFETVSANNGEKINFYLQNETDKQFILSDDIALNCCFAFGNFYYNSQNTHELKIMNLENGEVNSAGQATDFTLFDGELYVIKSDGFLYKSGGENKLNEINQFYNIYSDNINLYGIIAEYNMQAQRHDYFFVKINSDFSTEIIGKNGGK